MIARDICAETWLIAREMRGVQTMKRRTLRKIGYSVFIVGFLSGWWTAMLYEKADSDASLWPYIIALLISGVMMLVGDKIREWGEDRW